jgi:hypothetical protein
MRSESLTEMNIKMSYPTKLHLDTEAIYSSEMYSFTRLHGVTSYNTVVLYQLTYSLLT